jgi:thiamine pyrophosphate-dependent acetolactate synthase large subunit-like protein
MDDMTAASGAITWPRLDGLSADQIAVAQGVRRVRVTTREQLTEAVAGIVPAPEGPVLISVELEEGPSASAPR